jgi:hypothetical protein
MGLWDAVKNANTTAKTYPDDKQVYQDYTNTPDHIQPVDKER